MNAVNQYPMSPPNLYYYDLKPREESLLHAVRQGLSRPQKSLPPKYFYDETGSRLFDAICATPEYYPSHIEYALLDRYAAEISVALGQHCWLVEPGSGNSCKVRMLLEPLRPVAYQPLDISGAYLRQAASILAEDYPWLPIYAVCADFSDTDEHIAQIPSYVQYREPRAIFFPGSSIGNFEPVAAVAFLSRLGEMLGPGGSLLIGVDLKKESDVLHTAYNDTDGMTAAFNLNLLHRINRELGANFDPDGFRHQAFYNEALGRVEMHLASTRRQTVRVNSDVFAFSADETIHTENSYKYAVAEFSLLARQAGFIPGEVWTDEREWFSLQHYQVMSAAAPAA